MEARHISLTSKACLASAIVTFGSVHMDVYERGVAVTVWQVNCVG